MVCYCRDDKSVRNNRSSAQLWRRQQRAEERRKRTFRVGRLANLLPLVSGLEHGPRRGDRGSRQQVSRAIAGGASEPEGFHLPLRLLMTHFDRVDTEEGYTILHTFEMCNGMPFSDLGRAFRVLASTATGRELILSPGTGVVLEVARAAANEQLPALMPALYPGSKVTNPRPYASWDAIWRAFILVTKRIIRHLPSTAKHLFLLSVSSTGARSAAPTGPRPAVRSWARPGPSAVPVVFVADGIEPPSNCHAH